MWTWQFTVPWHGCRHLKVFWNPFSFSFFFESERKKHHTKELGLLQALQIGHSPWWVSWLSKVATVARRNSNERFLSAFGDHSGLVPSMTKCGPPGSDTYATGLPCAWPLHPHVFHTYFAISLFFLASSRHKCFRKAFLGREVNVWSERSCLTLSSAKQNRPRRGYIFPAPRLARALRGEGSRSTAAGGCSTRLPRRLPLSCWAKSHPGDRRLWK